MTAFEQAQLALQESAQSLELTINGSLALFAAMGIVIAIIQLCYIYGQVNVAIKATHQTDFIIKQMQLEQRAWLTALPSNVELSKELPFRYRLSIKNTGRTPAALETIQPMNFVLENELQLDDQLAIAVTTNPIDKRQIIFAPDSTTHFPVAGTLDYVRHHADAINAGTRVLFIALRLTYSDVFKISRSTHCCFFYDTATKSFVTHNQHNYMD